MKKAASQTTRLFIGKQTQSDLRPLALQQFHDHRDQKQNEEYKEQDPSDIRRPVRDIAESKDRRNDRDNEENSRPS